ncbi:MAG: hypothetical protein OXC80_04100 [Gammaproteobacteria bacterium]|nr:hypothetical protein [Gammaproteobacteria bacterium]
MHTAYTAIGVSSLMRDDPGKTYTALTGTTFSDMKRRDLWGSFMVAISQWSRYIKELLESREVQVKLRTMWR